MFLLLTKIKRSQHLGCVDIVPSSKVIKLEQPLTATLNSEILFLCCCSYKIPTEVSQLMFKESLQPQINISEI